jgi:putative PEP-CTERM system histidine kinase
MWSYGLASLGYAVFAIRVLAGSSRNARALLLVAALATTAAWAAICVSVGRLPTLERALAASAADALRCGAWFLFLSHLVSSSDQQFMRLRTRSRNAIIAVGALLVASVLLGEGTSMWQASAILGMRTGFLLKLGLAVFGLILVEQVFRRVQPQARWAIKPLVVALAGVFGFDLFFYADALLFGRLDGDIWLSRGVANIIVIPFIAIATARNTGWTVDLHLSRTAVFHSSSLLLSGAFLLLVALAGYFVRYVGGDWGRALQIELLFAAALFVALMVSSGRFRSRLKVFVSKHFFSYRYDYREEWLRFTRTLSTESGTENLQERTIMALADLLESPAGALWLRNDSNRFVQVARWNTAASDAVEPAEGSLATFFERTGWIVDVTEYRRDASRYPGLSLPPWLVDATDSPWLVDPLIVGTEVCGFVVLMPPRTPLEIDWEVRDLLKTASRQAASFLSHARATEALLEARKFDAFNRMSAFVVHDLKNLVSQLSLMLRNAQRHRDNPEFQADMLTTVEHVVNRMNRLMLQLRTGSEPVENARHVDLDGVLRRVCAAKAGCAVPIEARSRAGAMIIGHEDRLEHVISHLLQNAIDASSSAGPIRLDVEQEDRFTVVVIADTGIGMTQEFIRERLFRPFQTTKESGMGIGVYESRQYVASLGGSLEVESQPGIGTTVRIRLPRTAAVVEADAPVPHRQDSSVAAPSHGANSAVTMSSAAATPTRVEIHP